MEQKKMRNTQENLYKLANMLCKHWGATWAYDTHKGENNPRNLLVRIEDRDINVRLYSPQDIDKDVEERYSMYVIFSQWHVTIDSREEAYRIGYKLSISIDSIDDLNFVFATTIRNRKYSKDVFNPHEGMQFAHELLAQGDSLGILFGSERAGLEGKEIALANAIISIRVNPKFKSLNLSHAAGLLAYEWFKMSELGKKVDTNILFKDLKSATHSEINSFILNLKTELNRSGYFWPEAKRISLQRNLENLFHRLPLTGPDIRTLFGIIKSLTKLKDR